MIGAEHSRLNLGQRFHFLTGWLGWLGDGLNLLFNLIAIAWSTLLIAAPLSFVPPTAIFSSFVLALFTFKLAKIFVLYRYRVGASITETWKALIAGLALVYIVGRAVLAGLIGGPTRFIRTPKLADRDNAVGAIGAILPETALGFCLISAAIGTALTRSLSDTDTLLWCVLLSLSAVPHIAAVSLSLVAALPGRRLSADSITLDSPVSDSVRS